MTTRSAVLVCTDADKPLAIADSARANQESPFAFGVSATGQAPATHWVANADGISEEDYAALVFYFGQGNPYGRVLRDGAVQNVWDVIASLDLQRVEESAF